MWMIVIYCQTACPINAPAVASTLGGKKKNKTITTATANSHNDIDGMHARQSTFLWARRGRACFRCKKGRRSHTSVALELLSWQIRTRRRWPRKEGRWEGRPPLDPSSRDFPSRTSPVALPLAGRAVRCTPGNSLAAQAQGCLTNGIPPAGVKVFWSFSFSVGLLDGHWSLDM
ncbi:hypothetical protein BC826DRAFT_1017331 [Russula brevipes]|nr:hypothetical protein BC826DRAFT_1017331 [Russula brevipes]